MHANNFSIFLILIQQKGTKNQKKNIQNDLKLILNESC